MKPCKEKKKLLSGKEIIYNCELVTLDIKFSILKYVIEHQQQVGSLLLRAGTVSYGFYWIDRPYILYKWFSKNGDLLGDYFSIADSVRLSTKEFFWRDLIVDILVLPTGNVEVLDEDEVPEFLEENLRNYIKSGKQILLRNYHAIIAETNTILNQYFPQKNIDLH